MNAALGLARAHAKAGNDEAARDAANRAAIFAENNKKASAAVAQQMQSIQAAPFQNPTPTPAPPSGGDRKEGPYIGKVVDQPSPTTSNPSPPQEKPTDPCTRSSDYKGPKGIKQADPDVVLFDQESVSPELLLELEYENISGIELINISRSDIIDGQQVVYSPIKNLSSIRRRFNPNNIISMPELSSSYFASFSIDLVLRGIRNPYFDTNGDLIIEIDEVLEDEIIEAEVDSSGTIDVVEFL
jgi:hypothetical protein